MAFAPLKSSTKTASSLYAFHRTLTSNFCQNENNLTGLCNKQSCPLANSRYATIREVGGVCYLYKKVIERAHLPSKMWEKIKLVGSVEQVSAKIEKELEYMPNYFKIKCQERYKRIKEYLHRTQKLKNDPNQPILTVKKMKVVKREQKREARAKTVALIDNVIERELLERLKKGVYGEIYNLPQKTFESVLEKHGQQEEMNEELIDQEVEYIEDEGEIEGEEEDDEDAQYEYGSQEEQEESDVEYLDEFAGSEDELLMEDLEDLVHKKLKSTHKNSRARVEVEYEEENSEKHISK